MADFPSGPGLTVGQLFTSGWSTWMWDGVKWMASMPSGGVYEPVFGGTQYPMYGFLYNKTVGDPGYSAWAGFGAHRWRFGISPGDDFAAGSIDYRGYASDALNIVGAGTASGNRKINLFDNVNVTGNLTVVGTSVLDGITNTGAINSTGSLTIAGAISSTGSTAILTFQDRAGTTNWGWYAQGGIARLWNDQSGDRVTFDSGGSISTPGNIRTGSNIYMGGQALYFSGVTAGGPIVYGDTTNMTTQLGTGNGAFKWYSNPGAQIMNLDSAGSLSVTGSLTSGQDLYFKDRSGSPTLAWYSTGNITRFYNSGIGDILKIDSVGNFTTNGTINVGSGVIELGQDRGSDGYAYVDFHAQAGTDYDFRIIRNPGANGGASIVQNGSAPLTFAAPNFSFNTAAGTGNALLEIYGTSGWDSLRVRAPNGNFIVFKPETGAGWCQIGYYVAGNWGTIEILGNLQVDNVFYAAGISSGSNINMGGNYLTFQNSPANLGSSGPMLYGDSNWIVAKPGSGNYGFMLYDNAGQNRLQLMTWGGVMATGVGNGQGQFHMSHAPDASMYGSMWYNDGTTTYLLLTNNNDAQGSYNGLRPFACGNSSGNLTFGHAVTMNAGAWIGGNLTVNGSYLGMPNSGVNNFIDIYNSTGNWLHIFEDTNAHIESNARIWMNQQSGADVWMPALTVSGGIGCGSFGTNGNITCQGSIYTNHVVMNNACLLYGRDTVGTQQWLITMWSDNVIYVGDGSHDLHLRGYTTYVDNSNEFRCPNAIHAVGGNSMLQFDDRTDGFVWGWYATGSAARLWDNLEGDRVTIDRGGSITAVGNVRANGSIGTNGIWFGNNGGWFWTGSPIHTDSAVQAGLWITAGTDISAGGQLSCSGNLNVSGTSYLNGNQTRVHGTNANDSLTVTSSDYSKFLTVKPETQGNWCQIGYYCGSGIGWGTTEFVGQCYFDNNINCGDFYSRGNVNSAGVLYVGGLMIQNYTGWWWTANPIHTDSDLQCNGSLYFGGNRLYNNSGYAYFDQTVHAAGVYSRGDIWNAGSINSGNQLNCPQACTAGYLHSTSDVTANGWFTSGIGNGGAQVRCWAGDWGAMSYAISNQYFEISPDQGQSGFYYAPAGNWSDARLKLNIRDSEIDALGVIRSIPVRAYEWTEEGRGLMPRNGSSVACGIVAQELEELIPSAVDIVPVSGGLAGGGMRRIIGDQFDAYYIRAIQQLLARIEELENLVLNPPERNLA